MHILITRQLDQSKNFSTLLNELNIKNTIFPVIKIKKIKLNEKQIENIKKSDLIIFTSQNSVTALIDSLNILVEGYPIICYHHYLLFYDSKQSY